MAVGRRQMSCLVSAAAKTADRKWILLVLLDPRLDEHRELETTTAWWRLHLPWLRRLLRWRRPRRNTPLENRRGMHHVMSNFYWMNQQYRRHASTWLMETVIFIVQLISTSGRSRLTGTNDDDRRSRWSWSAKTTSTNCFNLLALTETASHCYKRQLSIPILSSTVVISVVRLIYICNSKLWSRFTWLNNSISCCSVAVLKHLSI